MGARDISLSDHGMGSGMAMEEKPTGAGTLRSRRAHFYTSPSGDVCRATCRWLAKSSYECRFRYVACGSGKGAGPFRCFAAIPVVTAQP